MWRDIREEMPPSDTEICAAECDGKTRQSVESVEIQSNFDEQGHQQQEEPDRPDAEKDRTEKTVCNQCVTLKAKVVALQKTCFRLRQKLPKAKDRLNESEMYPVTNTSTPFEANSMQRDDEEEPEEYSSDTDTAFIPQSQTSFKKSTEESETSSQSSGEVSDDEKSGIR